MFFLVGGPRIGIRLQHEHVEGLAIAVITADLGVADRLAPAEALATNNQLIHGSLATVGHTLVLRSLVFLDRWPDQELCTPIRFLAAEAAAIKELLVVPLTNSAAFSHFAD